MALFTFFTSVFLFHANHGQVRLFLIVGGLTGFLAYRWSLGRLVMAVSEEIVRWLKRLWQLLIWQPLLWCIRLLWHVLHRTGAILARFGRLVWRLGPGRLAASLYRGLRRIAGRERLNRCIRRLSDTMKL